MKYEIRKHRMQFKNEKDVYEGCSIQDTELGELCDVCSDFESALKLIHCLESAKWKEETYNGSICIVEEFAIHQVNNDGEPVEMIGHYTSTFTEDSDLNKMFKYCASQFEVNEDD